MEPTERTLTVSYARLSAFGQLARCIIGCMISFTTSCTIGCITK
jgi:hypothetical protein